MKKQSAGTEPELLAAYAVLSVLGIFFAAVLFFALLGPQGGVSRAPRQEPLELAVSQLWQEIAREAAEAVPLPTVPGGSRAVAYSILHPHVDFAFDSRIRDGVFDNAIVFSTGPPGGEGSEGLLLAEKFRLVAYTVEAGGGTVVKRSYPAFASLQPVRYNPALDPRTGHVDLEALQGAITEEVVATAPHPAWTQIRIGVVYPVALDDGMPRGKETSVTLMVEMAEYPGGDRRAEPRVVVRREAIPLRG